MRTLEELTRLANVLARQGRHEDALELRHRILEVNRESLGGDHPNTLLALNNLGAEHGSSINTLFNYAYMLFAMGREDEAYERYAESADLYRRALGTGHRRTLETDLIVASMMAEKGNQDRAEALIEDVITRSEESLGADHALTASAENALEDLQGPR